MQFAISLLAGFVLCSVVVRLIRPVILMTHPLLIMRASYGIGFCVGILTAQAIT
jgi:hypothetical protein